MSIYGVSTSLVKDLPRLLAFEKLATAGFEAVELSANDGHLENWLADPAGVRRELAAAGIRPWSVHSSSAGWDLAAPDPDDRAAAVRISAGSFRPAVEVGAEVVICHCNAPRRPFEPEDYDAALRRTGESLKALAEQAHDAGIRLAIENMIPRPVKRPATKVAEILALIEPLGEHVGICLDTGHANAAGSDVADEARLAGRRLFSLHLQDNHGQPDQDEHLVPGKGTIDWNAFLDALDELNFTAPRIFEVALAGGPERLDQILQELAELSANWQARPRPRGAG